MHARSISISNLRAHTKLEWRLAKEVKGPGWHVVIGDNGSGKSSFLRSAALAFVGPDELPALRQDWSNWLRSGSATGGVTVQVSPDREVDRFAGSGRTVRNWLLACGLDFRSTASGVTVKPRRFAHDPARHLWSKKPAWFAASYGPFRRFAGGDKDAEKLYYSNPRLARHLSVFGEGVALSECLVWLQQQQFKRLEAERRPNASRDDAVRLMIALKEFINSGDFLPHGAQMDEVTSDAVKFIDGNGFAMSVEELSDGYRSILSLTFELIRQLVETYGVDRVFADPGVINVPGVVLIDEIDAHLHPTWQRKIGSWLCAHFPKMQFIVTSHSPLICHATPLRSVFRLPRPGADEVGEMLTGATLNRLRYGNVLDAYSTGQFGADVTRSEGGRILLRRLAELNSLELERDLTEEELTEQSNLRAMFPTSPHLLPG